MDDLRLRNRLGVARPGTARFGSAWRGVVRSGEARIISSSHTGPGWVRFVEVRQGKVRFGRVGRGKARDFYSTKRKSSMFDISVDNVEAGSVLSQADCEALFGFSYEINPTVYQFKLMQLSDYVEKELAKLDRILTVVCDGQTVRVLTHEQASIYNQKHFDNAIRKMRRCNRRLQAVDIRELGPDRIKQHDGGIVRQSRILQAIKTSTRDITPEIRKIDRPVMFRKE